MTQNEGKNTRCLTNQDKSDWHNLFSAAGFGRTHCWVLQDQSCFEGICFFQRGEQDLAELKSKLMSGSDRAARQNKSSWRIWQNSLLVLGFARPKVFRRATGANSKQCLAHQMKKESEEEWAKILKNKSKKRSATCCIGGFKATGERLQVRPKQPVFLTAIGSNRSFGSRTPTRSLKQTRKPHNHRICSHLHTRTKLTLFWASQEKQPLQSCSLGCVLFMTECRPTS